MKKLIVAAALFLTAPIFAGEHVQQNGTVTASSVTVGASGLRFSDGSVLTSTSSISGFTKVKTELFFPFGVNDNISGNNSPGCRVSNGAAVTGDSTNTTGLEFPTTSTPTVKCTARIPATWDGGAMTAWIGGWQRTSSAGTVRYKISTVCPSNAATIDATYGSTTNLDITVSGSTVLFYYNNTVSVTPDASCSAGKLMEISIARDTGVASNFGAGFIAVGASMDLLKTLQ